MKLDEQPAMPERQYSGKQSTRHAAVTTDVIFQLVTAVIKMALRPGSGGGSRYFRLLKSTVSGKCHSFV